jgi:Holliday junction resolvasome RuvABC endonuclease subunit
MILGIDISTRCTGISIIDSNKNLIFFDAIDLEEVPELFEKTQIIEKYFEDLSKKYTINKIVIEQPLQRMSAGSSALTIAKLLQFNYVVFWICYKIFNLKPILVSATNARKKSKMNIVTHNNFIKSIKLSNQKKEIKKFILNELCTKYPTLNSALILKRTGGVRDHFYDIADSIIVALFGVE